MTTRQAIDWIYESVAKAEGCTVEEIRRRTIAGDPVIGDYLRGTH
jgi:hypothetical protein